MSLTDFPSIKPKESTLFIIALAIVIFIFNFTKAESPPTTDISGKTKAL